MYLVGGHSALRAKEILTPPATWMNPENVRASEISQFKRTHCRIPRAAHGRTAVARGRRGGE